MSTNLNYLFKCHYSKLVISLIVLNGVIGGCHDNNSNISINTNETLRVDIGSEVPTFDPALAEDGYTYRVINDLFAGLVDFDQANRPIPGLATWSISPDGLVYTFKLKSGLVFSDGLPIQASDVIFSWQRLVNPKTGSSYAFLLKDVVNAEEVIAGKLSPDKLGIYAPDNQTIIVKLSHPTNAFLNYLTTPDVFVVSQKNLEQYGESWTNPKNIVSSGAYVLKEHVINGYILVEKNPYYYQESQVAIKYVRYFPFVDINTAVANYKTGDLDMTWQSVPVDQYRKLKKDYPTQLHSFPWERMEFINLNMTIPQYANNIKLRQALSMAIDRDILAYNVLGGGQTPLYGIVTPTIENGKYSNIAYSWANLTKDERIKIAKKLYQEAGFGQSNPLTLTLKYQTNAVYKKVMIAIAAMWAENLGIKVNLVNEERKALSQDWRNANYDVAQGTWGADYNNITTYTPQYLCNNGNNRSHYCSKDYDALIHKAEATINLKQQEELYKQALNIVMQDYPIIPLYQPVHQRLVADRVYNYDIDTNYLDNVQTKWFYFQKN